MHKKLLALLATGLALQADILAHPGHGNTQLQASILHWIVEPVHLGVSSLLLVAAVAGLYFSRNRWARRQRG